MEKRILCNTSRCASKRDSTKAQKKIINTSRCPSRGAFGRIVWAYSNLAAGCCTGSLAVVLLVCASSVCVSPHPHLECCALSLPLRPPARCFVVFVYVSLDLFARHVHQGGAHAQNTLALVPCCRRRNAMSIPHPQHAPAK